MPPRAKPGRGTVMVVDVGKEVCAGDSSFFKQAKECLKCVLQRKLFSGKGRDCVGIVLFGTRETQNQLASEDDQFQHITVMQNMKVVDWDVLKCVDDLMCGGCTGDWMDALMVAMDLLYDPVGNQFSERNIVLLTDFSGEFSDDQSDAIIEGLSDQNIDLVVIGPEILKDLNEDQDDSMSDILDEPNGTDKPGPSSGVLASKQPSGPKSNWDGKPKTMVQLAGEAVVARLVSKVGGVVLNFDDALADLKYFEREAKTSVNWNANLEIGDEVSIEISARIKVEEAKIPPWQTDYAKDSTQTIIKEKSYHLYDERQTEVNEEEIIDGYKYGTTLVPYPADDLKMSYCSNSPKGLSVVGFTESKNVSYGLRIGDQALEITARDGNVGAQVALSALIQALVEKDKVCIARRIQRDNAKPVIGALIPVITQEQECLIWMKLPFKQDVRHLSFPSLSATMEKLKEDKKAAINSFITCMDLDKNRSDDEEEGYFDPMNVLNPTLQYYQSVLIHRALHPNGPLPSPAPHIMKILEPPAEIAEARDSIAAKINSLFPTKRNLWEPKKLKENLFDIEEDKEEGKRKKARTDDDDDDTSLNAAQLLRPQVTQVSTVSPAEDFMAMLKGIAPDFVLICDQMGEVVVQLVQSLPESCSEMVKRSITDKVLNCLKTFREESLHIDPATYNKFLYRLKDVVISLALLDLWGSLKEGNLGLINDEETMRSRVRREEAERFLQLSEESHEAPAAPTKEAGEDEIEDLLDDL